MSRRALKSLAGGMALTAARRTRRAMTVLRRESPDGTRPKGRTEEATAVTRPGPPRLGGWGHAFLQRHRLPAEDGYAHDCPPAARTSPVQPHAVRPAVRL